MVALIFCGWLGDRLGQRLLVSMMGLSIALLGMILIVALPLSNNSGRLAGYYLTQASPTPFVALLSLISSNVAGYTKKVSLLFHLTQPSFMRHVKSVLLTADSGRTIRQLLRRVT